jgi:hypothetical protein
VFLKNATGLVIGKTKWGRGVKDRVQYPVLWLKYTNYKKYHGVK